MSDRPLDQRFADTMGQLLGPDFPSDLGLAVSGGGDSMAMLYLAHNWTRTYGVRLWVVTIDHGLRADSASEAEMVAEECAALGWPHATVRWAWDGQGNVQDAARRARLALMDRWRGAVSHVLVAHTQDDQAETVLMRLARGSGVDGLAGMRERRDVFLHPLGTQVLDASDVDGQVPPQSPRQQGFTVLRPCLGFAREDLRHYARVLKGRWVEDPSNEDPRFDRVRIRKALGLLANEGISASDLADTADRMARARDALTTQVADAARRLSTDGPVGQVVIDRDGFHALDRDIQMRLLTAAICYVASSEYRPRAHATETMLDRLLSGGGGTLHGTEILVEPAQFRVMREFDAVRNEKAVCGELWDQQWLLQASDNKTASVVHALGDEGWSQIKDATQKPIPYRAALALPSVWHGDTLKACPALIPSTSVHVQRFVLGRRDLGFEAFCLSH